MTTLFILIIFLVILNFIILFNHSKLSKIGLPFDKPDNNRKLHPHPVLISGGFIFLANFIIIFLYAFLSKDFFLNEIFQSDLKFFVFFSILIISYLVGFCDDKYELNAYLKLILLSVMILTILFSNDIFILKEIKFSFTNKSFYLDKFSIPFTILCILLFVNSINMFDGINLQSSTYLIIFIFYFFAKGITSSFLILLIISFIFFFILNFKNKSFIGDGGCFLISIIFGTFCIAFYNLGYIDYSDDIALIMIIPGIDMFRLFLTRIFSKRNPFSPDRKHLHHLLEKKIGYNKTIISIITFNLSILFLVVTNLSNIYNLSFILIIYSLVVYNIEYK